MVRWFWVVMVRVPSLSQSENARLKQEVSLLKKWQRFLAEEHQLGIDSSRDSDES